MGSLKSPGTTSYRSPIETMALNCLLFEKIAILYFGDRQTDRQADEQMHKAALGVASGGLISTFIERHVRLQKAAEALG